MNNLFCTSINKIVFLIIITYILYICTFINIIVFKIINMTLLSIAYIYKSGNNNINRIFIEISYILCICQCKRDLCFNK